MGIPNRRIVNGIVAGTNLAASLVTLVPLVAVVALAASSLVAPPVVAGAALVTAVGGGLLIARRAGRAAVRARSNTRTGPLLREALVAVAESSRELALRDPARGGPSADALAAWSPGISAVDRALRRVDFEQEVLTYLLWLVAEVRHASDTLREGVAGQGPWRNEWLVVRERLSLLGCLLLCEARRRGARDVVTSFAGNPNLAPPAGYGDRTMTAANDVALRGAPTFPTDAAYSPCAPSRVGTDGTEASGARQEDGSTDRSVGEAAKAVAVAIGVAGSFLLGTVVAFWLVAVLTGAAPAFEWAPTVATIAAGWWIVAYGATALFGGVSYAWAAWSELEDAVLHLDPAAATAAPVLSAVVAWLTAFAVGAGARAMGGQPDVAAAVAFTLVTVVAGLRLVASRA